MKCIVRPAKKWNKILIRKKTFKFSCAIKKLLSGIFLGPWKKFLNCDANVSASFAAHGTSSRQYRHDYVLHEHAVVPMLCADRRMPQARLWARQLGPTLWRGAHNLHERKLQRRPVHARRVLRPVGAERAGLPEVDRARPLLVRQAAPTEPVDEEGLRLGLQGVRLPLRPRAHQERPRLGAADHGESVWRSLGRRSVEKEEEEEQEPETSFVADDFDAERRERLSVESDAEAVDEHRRQCLQHDGSAAVSLDAPAVDNPRTRWQSHLQQRLVVARVVSQRWQQPVGVTRSEQPRSHQAEVFGAGRDVLGSHSVSFFSELPDFFHPFMVRLNFRKNIFLRFGKVSSCIFHFDSRSVTNRARKRTLLLLFRELFTGASHGMGNANTAARVRAGAREKKFN